MLEFSLSGEKAGENAHTKSMKHPVYVFLDKLEQRDVLFSPSEE